MVAISGRALASATLLAATACAKTLTLNVRLNGCLYTDAK